jgi:hypothetical protein
LDDDFLEHFDLLIDSANRLLCLDNSATMCAEVKGPRIPLLATAEADRGLLIITARLSAGLRPVRLLLDSGANVAILFNTFEYMSCSSPTTCNYAGGVWMDAADLFGVAAPGRKDRPTRIAPRVRPRPRWHPKDVRVKGFDGDLPTWLFRRVFIDNGDHFAVLEPRQGPILAAYAFP